MHTSIQQGEGLKSSINKNAEVDTESGSGCISLIKPKILDGTKDPVLGRLKLKATPLKINFGC